MAVRAIDHAYDQVFAQGAGKTREMGTNVDESEQPWQPGRRPAG